MDVPVSTSHKRTVLSSDAEASLLSSGEKLMEQTIDLWPSKAMMGTEMRSGDDYYDKMSLGSTGVGSRFGATEGGDSGGEHIVDGHEWSGGGGGAGGGEEQHRLRRDDKYKIATMQSCIVGLKHNLGGKGNRYNKWAKCE